MSRLSLGVTRVPIRSRARERLRARGAMGGAVVGSLVLLVVCIWPLVRVVGARRVLGERGGVVGLGKEAEDREADYRG